MLLNDRLIILDDPAEMVIRMDDLVLHFLQGVDPVIRGTGGAYQVSCPGDLREDAVIYLRMVYHGSPVRGCYAVDCLSQDMRVLIIPDRGIVGPVSGAVNS